MHIFLTFETVFLNSVLTVTRFSGSPLNNVPYKSYVCQY